jgi:two-component system, cell cycle response regulator DivK
MKKGLVLVVEDDEDNRHLVVFLLKTGGLEVIEADDGREGLAKAQHHHPDLILLDMSIPEINGWDLARLLKANPDTRNICVVALTGHTQAGDRQKALDAGCDGYISKPLDTLTFIQQVTEFLNHPS